MIRVPVRDQRRRATTRRAPTKSEVAKRAITDRSPACRFASLALTGRTRRQGTYTRGLSSILLPVIGVPSTLQADPVAVDQGCRRIAGLDGRRTVTDAERGHALDGHPVDEVLVGHGVPSAIRWSRGWAPASPTGFR